MAGALRRLEHFANSLWRVARYLCPHFFGVFFGQDFNGDVRARFERGGFDDVAKRVGHAAFTPDDAANVVGMNAHAVDGAGLVVELFDFDILRACHDALHEIADQFNEAVFGARRRGRRQGRGSGIIGLRLGVHKKRWMKWVWTMGFQKPIARSCSLLAMDSGAARSAKVRLNRRFDGGLFVG